ncbi:MAG: haloacid dehalogenase type II, partial [Hyphomicrobiales bacterium]
AELEGYFEQVLSTDAVRRFKPDASAYRMAMEGFGLEREEILFVPFAGWDAAGAKWFGYETFWVNRLGTPPEELGVVADATGANLSDLVRFLGAKG